MGINDVTMLDEDGRGWKWPAVGRDGVGDKLLHNMHVTGSHVNQSVIPIQMDPDAHLFLALGS